MKKKNSDWCVDYADVRQAMGDVCNAVGDKENARYHNRIAMRIYEGVLKEELLLLEEKRRENLVGQL